MIVQFKQYIINGMVIIPLINLMMMIDPSIDLD